MEADMPDRVQPVVFAVTSLVGVEVVGDSDVIAVRFKAPGNCEIALLIPHEHCPALMQEMGERCEQAKLRRRGRVN